MNFHYIRRKIIQARFFLARANGWANTPMMIIVFLGVLAPYVSPYYNYSLWYAFPIVTIGLVVAGYIEYRLGFPKADAEFTQDQNANLNGRIKRVENKVDKIINYIESKNE